ncbi:MAG: EAL domain-containing protein [Motiliproteus sp.]|nr:EAL domain-containing protein [Motiliproteus sp.]MCW9051961.1 EAL domain-containing protein [Motiliproteus sp.]
MVPRHLARAIGLTAILLLIPVNLGLTQSPMLSRLNLIAYDWLLPFHAPSMSDQITIIAVDEASIRRIGRWPWPRQQHAELLDQLTAFQPSAVVFDILFSEAGDPISDSAFADAIERNGRTVLVVAPAKETSDADISELLPIPALAEHAAALGHVDVELDSDGISRHFYLYGGIGAPHWPSAALAMLEVAGIDHNATGLYPNQNSAAEPSTPENRWVRSHRRYIPFSSHDQAPNQISYSDIIDGHVSALDIRNKLVLVGTTSSGIGDMLYSPSEHSHQRMPGVALLAQQLNGLLQEEPLAPVSNQTQILLTLGLSLFVGITTLCLPFRFAPFILISQIAVTLGTSALLLISYRLWFSPAPTIAMLIGLWGIWSVWRLGVESSLTKKLKQRLEHQSQHHSITGLPNQHLLEEYLRRLTAQPSRVTVAALLLVHIDWPKSATTALGRSMGDSILQSVALRLKTTTNPPSFIAHLSSDDFAILLSEQEDNHQVIEVAEEFLRQLKKPFIHFDDEVVLSPNIGVSIWPTDGNNALALLQNANTAMFKSRMDADQGLCVYSADISQEIKTRSQLEQAMRYAMERDEFEVYYQPQIDTISGNIIGAEALLRWDNPQLGRISPATFIPVAEHSGLIVQLGDWVLNRACNDLASLEKQGLGPLRIAVNLSPLQFSSADLISQIKAAIDNAGINPQQLELEVTESTLIDNVEQAIETMREIKRLGVSFAIDDFGTGYSSLSQLQNFPLNRLKIDQSFTQNIGIDDNSTQITLTIIAMAKRLGMVIIAEGVETEDQAAFLLEHECEELQGYLFSHPIPIAEFTEKLSSQGRVEHSYLKPKPL